MPNEEKTVRLNLRRTVARGGKVYGPGPADVPESLAASLQASGATPEGDARRAPAESPSAAGTSSGEEKTEKTEKTERKPATKTALREFGDADALRELAKSNKVKVSEDATKAELIEALHDAEISLDE
jgi:hypothetical protein